MRGFSLIELMVAVALLAIVTAVALPIYQSYSVRAARTSVQADLLRCAQGMERHASARMNYERAVDSNDDGVGDVSTGPVSRNICIVDAAQYDVTVQFADAGRFVLRARPSRPSSAVGRDGMLELDSAGGRRWDRNNDGDFDDGREREWQP